MKTKTDAIVDFTIRLISAVALIAVVVALLALPVAASSQPTCTLSVSPSVIAPGGSITLAWSSTNTTGGAITNVGNVGQSGSVNLLPSSASVTNYLGSFTGPGGTVNCSASVNVSLNQSSGGSGNAGAGGVTNAIVPSLTQTQTAPISVSLPSTVEQPNRTLVPCGLNSNPNDLTQTGATGCQACNLAQLTQNIINFCIGLSIPIAALLFSYAGALYFTSSANEHNITKAKAIFRNAFFGFLIAITGWLVVNTLLHALLDGGHLFSGGNWFTIQCSPDASRNRVATINQLINSLPVLNTNANNINSLQTVAFCDNGDNCYNYQGQLIPGATPGSSLWSGNVTQYCTTGTCTNDQAQSAIGAYDAKAGANQLTSSSNVSYLNSNPALLQALILDVSAANSGTVNVTSADDGTHTANSNHYGGNAVDISMSNSQFNAYIATLMPVTNPIASGQPAYKDLNGYIWSYEPPGATANTTGPHWHLSSTGR